jgi:hypothetical protein
MKQFILNMHKQSNATLNRDRLRDLLMIDQLEAIKHEVHLFIISIINILIVL